MHTSVIDKEANVSKKGLMSKWVCPKETRFSNDGNEEWVIAGTACFAELVHIIIIIAHIMPRVVLMCLIDDRTSGKTVHLLDGNEFTIIDKLSEMSRFHN